MRNFNLFNHYSLLKKNNIVSRAKNIGISVIAGILIILTGFSAKAQTTLAQYTFTSPAGATCATKVTSVAAQPSDAVFSNYTNVGATCVTSTTGFVNTKWNTGTTINLAVYNTFTITPNAGFTLTLTNLIFSHFTDNKITSWSLRSSIDNFASDVATGTITTVSKSENVTLPSTSFTNIGAVTFRLYATGAKTVGTAWTNDNVSVTGQITPVTPSNPTSNSPQCNPPGVTLTRAGTPPAGQTWYWQTTATGTATTSSLATYNVTTSGTYYIRARSNGTSVWSNGAGSLAVVVTPNVGTPSFTAGATSTRCQGAGTITYTANAANTTGITYSLDAASKTAGNTINTSTGAVTYVAGWAGTSTIIASAAGCNGPTTATHTVTTNLPPTTPVFTLGSTTTRCQGAGTVTYTATANNTSGITYSLDANSLTAGNTIVGSTGTVTYVAGWSGTSTITATAAALSGCTPQSSTHSVTITPTVGVPVFAMGATSNRCHADGIVTYTATSTNNTGISYSLDANSLAAGNTIDGTTGTVTYVDAWTGTTTITATATGCNGPVSSNHTVTVNASVTTPVFSAGASSIRCQGALTVSYPATANNTTGITYSLDAASISGGNTINAGTGAVTYAAGWSGTSVITASAAGCYGPLTTTHTVTITPTVGTPVFTMGATSTRCQGTGIVTYDATATTTTGITYSLNAASITGGNTIDATTGAVTYAAGWSGTTIITASAAGCNGPKTSNHTVTVTATVGTPVFVLGASSVRCQNAGTITYTANATTNTGITYTLDSTSLANGNTINASTGAVTFVASWTGSSVITATATGCNGPSTASDSVTTTATVGTPIFTIGSTSTRCQGAGTVTYDATATTTSGITYTLDAASKTAGNTINAATGAVTYVATWSGTTIITASAAGCNGPKTSTHSVTITPTVGVPVFAMGATSNRCHADGIVTYTATSTNNTGISYSLDANSLAAGNTIDGTTGTVTFVDAWTGTTTITATATGCNGPVSSNHTVTVNASVTTPVFSAGASSIRCQGALTVSYPATANNTTGITYSLDAASISGGNTINAATGAVTYAAGWSGTSVITASAAGCYGPLTTTHTVTITPTVGTPVFTMGATSTRCQGTGVVTYDATATTTTGITYSLNAASITGGNTIDATTGAVTYAAGWSGTTIITASAAGCNGPKTSTHTVTVTATVGTPVFVLGASSVRCQNAGTITYTANATTNTGISYTLDSASIANGNTINASTGAVTFVASWTGSSVITATATGCNGPSTASHSVTTTATVGTPIFTIGSTSIRCQGAGTVTYDATATTTSGITYTLDAASKTAGNTINAATGAVTYVATWSGTTIITASAAGCNGPKTSTHSVTITPTVGVPVFAMGATSNRCHADGIVTYTATSTNNTGISYSLDANSLAAGNTIDGTTGAVTYVDAWTGTTTITATATGCNGPVSSNHTVTVNASVTTPVFSAGASSIRCQGALTVSYPATANNTTGITYSLDAASISGGNTINAGTGAVTYAAGWSGTSVITASAAGCYGPLTTTHTVTITPTVGTPVFTMGATSTRCQGTGVVTYDATATTTTGITYSLNAASITGGNTIDATTGAVTYAAGWSGTTIITASAAGCNGPKTSNHTVTVTATVGTPVFVLGASSVRCQNAGTINYTANATTNTGITYTLDSASIANGNTINASTGAVTFVASWTGSSVITATATGCNGPSTASHSVTTTPYVTTPVFNAGPTSTRCQGAGNVTYDATANYTTGITYSLDATTDAYPGNSINTTTGVVTYAAGWSGTSTITATAAGCTPKTSTHTVTTTATVGLPVFSLGSTSSRCQAAGTVTYTATATTNTGITYSLDATSLSAGNTINTTNGLVTYAASWSGTTVITATATGCNGPRSSNHTVTVNAPVTVPVFDMGDSSTRCQLGEKIVYSATANNTLGALVYSLDATSLAGKNKIKSTTGEITYDPNWTGISTITVSAPGCYGPQTATHVITTIPYVGTPVFTMGTSSTRCQGAGKVTYDASATNTTGITYSLNGPSITGGNTINAATGEVTYAAGWSGTTIITASAAGCSGPATKTHTVTVTPTVGTPTFTAGTTSTRCQGAGTVTYTANATTYTSKTYTLDSTSIAAGNYVNPSTGAVSYTAEWSGTTIITVTVTGCNGPKTATHTVTVTPSVGTPVFALGASSTRCRGAGTVTYSATSTDNTGITYSLDAASRAGLNTINSATGAVTFALTWTGTSTITVSASGCNGPEVATHIVTTNPPVTTPVFSAGSSSTRCQGAGTTTYTATSSYSSGLTYSLDATSLAAGNTINSATGAVTYTALWNGTSVITVSAAGCFGPLTANHTVTTTSTVATPVFNSGSSSTRCNGAGTVTYSATATTTITYSLDANTTAGGNTINSSTGAVNYVTGWVGTATITARAAGCGTPAATHTAVSTPSVAAPVFTLGTTSSRCQGAGSITYTSSSANSTKIIYSLDANSVTGGNKIDSITGQVTYVATWSGSSIVTATATGCNGPKSSNHTVTVVNNGTSSFALGPISSRIQSAGTVTYTATANNGATVTYSLDAASIAGGNTINASTGVVTYVATWAGTTIITATATGCGGNVSSNHTATIYPSSVLKQLYLSDPSQALDRIDPVASNDLTTSTTAVLANGSSTTFIQNPALCSQLIIKTGGRLTIENYITVTAGSMPASPAITAILKYGTTTFLTLSNPTYSSSTGLVTWSYTPTADITIPAGQAISLTITSAQANASFTINYDSKTQPSKINLPVSTYINILSLNVYNAPYPGGSVITGAITGSTNYIRAVVTDPFGSNDITGLDLTITPTGSTVAATSVATTGCNRTYEYAWKSSASAGYYDISGTAKEGLENTVTSTKSMTFSNCTACPPMALNDSATGAGGAPLLINVLANDTDPNNNINPASLMIVTQPANGTAVISNGQVVYLPNGTFTGTDQFTYQICDLTSPTPLCATATVTVDIDPTIVDPCSETSQPHTYYIPFPEQDARTALINSTAAAYLPIPSNNIRTIISIKVPYPGMTITWDQWEDGYEANLLSPTQSTTKVWGDGNPYNGIAPGYPNDIIPAGGSIVLDNTMAASPRVASNFYYDGKDRVFSSGEITLTQVLGEPSIIGVQAMKTNVSSTNEFGTSFTIPVGEDFPSQDFRYTALFVRAAQNNTIVNIDRDNDKVFDTTLTLNMGQSALISKVQTGATITGSAPIGVDLHFGGVDGYSSREVPIYPATWYSNVYYTPVPTTKSPDSSVVMLYNNLNRPISITWSSGLPATGNISLPAKTVVRFPLALSATNTYKFVNPTGESFTAIEIVDSYTPVSGGNSGSTFDWAFNLISADRLTTFGTIAWAPGSTDGTRNDNPIWVTPASNTTIYVKYNGNVLTGGSVSPCGLHYDVSYNLNALKYKKIFDSDNDQSGIAVYTCDGTKIAMVYGEDPASALDANPSWDVGSTIKPFCASKLIFANDDYAYTLTDRAVTIPVLDNDAAFTAVIDPASIAIGGGYLRLPKHGTVTVNSNGTLLYKPAPGYTGLDTLEYRVCSTPTVVCDDAMVIIKISGCPSPVNRNIISGQVFFDKNKDGLNNDGSIGFTPAKVYLYVDGNCNASIDANELVDSVSVDSSGSYQFLRYPEKTIADDFDGATGSSCASGSDGNTAWRTNWVDAGDISVGYCPGTPLSYANSDAEIVLSGGSYALRLKDHNISATRTANLSGATSAFLSFTYRRAKASLTTGKNVQVQASKDGITFTTIFTIAGDGTTDATKVNVYNLDIAPYISTATYIRFVTNANVADADEVYIDDVELTFLKYPTCYIINVDPASIPSDYFITSDPQTNITASSGGTCLFPFDFGVAKSIITISGNLYNDVNGLKDNLVNGVGTGSPSGNTVYAYLVDSLGKIEAQTPVNGISGAYSFTNAEVTTKYTIVLSTIDSPLQASPPSSAGLPVGWVSVGDAFGSVNIAGSGNETGTPDCAIAVQTGLFPVTGVNFGIERIPTAGSGSNSAINPGGTISVTVPATTFSNLVANTDPSPGIITSLRITAFPNNATTITINGVAYNAANFPAAGIIVPTNTSGQPTQTITVDPVDGFIKVVIPFYVIDNAGVQSTTMGTATMRFLIDTDKDGVADIYDIDDDNDGIIDIIEVCGNGATSFACMPSKTDPAADDDDDGIVNYKDADYGVLNANGCVASLDTDGDGIPDFLDLDSDNDGIPDVVEAFGVDANGDGIIDNFTDPDGDGLSQNVDASNTGVANSGNGLGFVDYDKDGIPNSLDLDSDNDGIPDIIEAGGTDMDNNGILDTFIDTDGDGFADVCDGDADNNGIIENTTGPLLKTGADINADGRPDSYPNRNTDRAGYPNPYDLDSDGDGITDAREAGFPGTVVVSNGMINGARTNGWANTVRALTTLTVKNTDGNGPPDYLDIDSDDDGISDNVEGQPTFSYKVPTNADVDNDGLADVYEVSVGTFGGGGITPYDHDADGVPDYMDLDTDGDGAPDINEASKNFAINQTNINTADTDGDGMLDEFDNVNILTITAAELFKNVSNSNMGPNGDFNGPVPTGSMVKLVRSGLTGDRDWRNNSILPLQILSFTGTLHSNIVTLNWKVVNEQDIKNYEIERSANGRDFEKIGSVDAVNNNTKVYTYYDDLSSYTSTTAYYRLKQVNKNGQVYFTNVILFKLDKKIINQLNIYPNPFENIININISSMVKDVIEVRVMDVQGKRVLTQNFDIEAGQNLLTLKGLGGISKGIYLVEVKSKDETWTEKIIKQ